MKGSEIDDPGHLIGLKPRRFPNWGARQQPIKICPLCYLKQLFQNLRPKLKYSKNRILVTSHFGTLLWRSYASNGLTGKEGRKY